MCSNSIATDTLHVMSTKYETLDPIQGVLEILNRASMTGTHKLALLLVLLDLAPEVVEGDQRISTYRLASRYLDIHWEHGRPYGDTVLRQTSSKKERRDGTLADDATVMQEIYKLRNFLVGERRGIIRDKPFHLVRYHMEQLEKNREWEVMLQQALSKIGDALWKNPIRRLQRLPGNPRPFLFEQKGRKRGILLLKHVPEKLTQFSGVLRPLIEFRFSERVTSINHHGQHAPKQSIHTHLFGRTRIIPPDKMKRELAKLQGWRCIFTGEPLDRTSLSSDHVLPWSRHRLSQIENFIITTKTVNSGKSDSLAGPDIIKRWLYHIRHNREAIRDLAQRFRWPTDAIHLIQVTSRIYESTAPGTGVWQGGQGIQPLGEQGQREITEILRRALSSKEYRPCK